MIVIRRLIDRNRAYTGIFLKGEPPQIFPTTDYEHARILQIYKQDRPYEGILNDFTDYSLGQSPAPDSPLSSKSPKREPAAAKPRRGVKKKSP